MRKLSTAAVVSLIACLALCTVGAAQQPYPTTYPSTGVPPYGQQATPAPGNNIEQPGAQLAGQPPTQPVAQPAAPQAEPIERGEILGWVGSEPILAGDVLPSINELLSQNAEQLANAPEEEVKRLKRMLMQREVERLIDNKLLFVEAKRDIPKENLEQIYKRIGEEFEKSQLDRLYQATKTTTRQQLQARLATLGSSIEQQKRMFLERTLGSQWMRQKVNTETEITHQQMLKYYWDHIEEYENEAKAKWEELTVDFNRFESRADAYAKLAQMGNAVFQGAELADVARRDSQGISAFDGGQYDWTTRGALRSEELNRALFTLPVGELSPIIETETGFHIIRVQERVDAGRTPFVEAQVEIKKTLEEEHAKNEISEFVKKLRSSTRVWTVFEGQTASRP